MRRSLIISRLSNKQLYRALSLFKKSDLRSFAREKGIPLGLNKECTLYNLVQQRSKLKDVVVKLDLS